MPIRCILLDIEGTIIPVAFVRDVLFPYSKQHMASFLQDRRQDQAVSRWVELCRDAIAQETGVRPSYENLAIILGDWIEKDRKHPGLKALQGMIWEEGYRTGAFAPDLYGDVASSLRRWRHENIRLAIYSSGSEQAQRLLLGHTTDGDITPLFSHFFDTGMGSKKESASYRRIADLMGFPPDKILFLSDAEPELDAAAAAGLSAVQVVRPGTSPGARHPVCVTLDGFSHPDMLDTGNGASRLRTPPGTSRNDFTP